MLVEHTATNNVTNTQILQSTSCDEAPNSPSLNVFQGCPTNTYDVVNRYLLVNGSAQTRAQGRFSISFQRKRPCIEAGKKRHTQEIRPLAYHTLGISIATADQLSLLKLSPVSILVSRIVPPEISCLRGPLRQLVCASPSRHSHPRQLCSLTRCQSLPSTPLQLHTQPTLDFRQRPFEVSPEVGDIVWWGCSSWCHSFALLQSFRGRFHRPCREDRDASPADCSRCHGYTQRRSRCSGHGPIEG